MDDNGIFIDSAFFVWKKTDKGYCWDESLKTKEEFGDTLLLENPESTSLLEYYPLDDNPTLFLDFADIEPTKEKILQFANQYGLLTESFFNNFKESHRWLQRVDSLKLFRSEVWSMKSAVFLWELLKNSNIEELRKIIRWDFNNENKIDGIHCEFTFEDSSGKFDSGFLISSDTNPQVFSRFIKDDPVLPSRVILQRIINKQLKKYPLNPRLLLDDRSNLQPYLYPTSLLAAMWYQLYQAISTNRKFKRCVYCNRWNDITEKAHNWRACPGCSGRARAKRSWLKKKEAEANAHKN
jgi:hypothetical protein